MSGHTVGGRTDCAVPPARRRAGASRLFQARWRRFQSCASYARAGHALGGRRSGSYLICPDTVGESRRRLGGVLVAWPALPRWVEYQLQIQHIVGPCSTGWTIVARRTLALTCLTRLSIWTVIARSTRCRPSSSPVSWPAQAVPSATGASRVSRPSPPARPPPPLIVAEDQHPDRRIVWRCRCERGGITVVQVGLAHFLVDLSGIAKVDLSIVDPQRVRAVGAFDRMRIMARMRSAFPCEPTHELVNAKGAHGVSAQIH